MRKPSIKRKLRFIIISLSGVSILLMAVILIANNVFSLRRTMVQDLATLARVIGSNCTAALAFNDANEASQTLQALRERPNIVAAVLYTATKEVFATYVRDPGVAFSPPPAPPDQIVSGFGEDNFSLFAPVFRDGDRLGTLYLRSDLRAMRTSLRDYLVIVAAVLALCLIAAVVMSRLLQRFILSPIERLAETVRLVSDEKDYTLRVHYEGRDEVGLLINGFNEMLKQIQLRDASLREAQTELEERVMDRTRELQREIGEKELAQERLKEIVEELKRSNVELERFAYVASHDLQEPLRMVASYTQLLEEDCRDKLDGDAGEFLRFARDGALRMQQLIKDLLEYSRVGRTTTPPEKTDCNEVLKKALLNLDTVIRENRALVTSDRLGTVLGNEFQLVQLFQNLIGNAIKFRGKDAPAVHLSSEKRNGRVVFSVSDNGIGIDPRYHQRVFEIFQRLHGREEYPGTGIGLAICKKIIEVHGGRIWIDSEAGKGATFYFTLTGDNEGEAHG